jgi:outer membrane lipoprotein-sorting protein
MIMKASWAQILLLVFSVVLMSACGNSEDEDDAAYEDAYDDAYNDVCDDIVRKLGREAAKKAGC